jgi:GTP cyclohydrolase FolE2
MKKVMAMAGGADISRLVELIDENTEHLSAEFIRARMEQARAVDEVLGRMV